MSEKGSLDNENNPNVNIHITRKNQTTENITPISRQPKGRGEKEQIREEHFEKMRSDKTVIPELIEQFKNQIEKLLVEEEAVLKQLRSAQAHGKLDEQKELTIKLLDIRERISSAEQSLGIEY